MCPTDTLDPENIFSDIPVQCKLSTDSEPIKVGCTREGFDIYRKENGAGGHLYWSDEWGITLWDTTMCSPELMRQLLYIEDTFNKPKQAVPHVRRSCI